MNDAGALIMLSNSDPKNENPDDNFLMNYMGNFIYTG